MLDHKYEKSRQVADYGRIEPWPRVGLLHTSRHFCVVLGSYHYCTYRRCDVGVDIHVWLRSPYRLNPLALFTLMQLTVIPYTCPASLPVRVRRTGNQQRLQHAQLPFRCKTARWPRLTQTLSPTQLEP